LILALRPASSLSRDAAIEATTNRLGAVSIGHLVDSKAEVDALVREAESAGAVVTDLRSVSPRALAWSEYKSPAEPNLAQSAASPNV
jgi:hypothetical protein